MGLSAFIGMTSNPFFSGEVGGCGEAATGGGWGRGVGGAGGGMRALGLPAKFPADLAPIY